MTLTDIAGWFAQDHSAVVQKETAQRSEVQEPLAPPPLQRQFLDGMGFVAGLGAGLGAVLAGYAFLMEPFNLRLERMTIRLPRARGKLPAGGLRLLHLSDSHFQGRDWREKEKIERVHRTVAGLEYDLLVHTGDFLHTDAGLANVKSLLDVLPRPRLGAYAVLGNHDYARYTMSKALRRTWDNFLTLEALQQKGPAPSPSRLARTQRYLRFGRHLLHNRIDGERTGTNDVAQLEKMLARQEVQLLHNRAVRIQTNATLAEQTNGRSVHEVDLYLAGVDDIHEGKPDLAAAVAETGDAPLVLLSHNPDVIQLPQVERADLILAGHTHGGQIVLPVVGPAHTQSDYFSRQEASGYLRRGNLQLYINRGMGEGIPLRLGAPPQLTLITLMAE